MREAAMTERRYTWHPYVRAHDDDIDDLETGFEDALDLVFEQAVKPDPGWQAQATGAVAPYEPDGGHRNGDGRRRTAGTWRAEETKPPPP